MSIEKLDFSRVKQQNKSFTTYLNEVIQNIHNSSILGVYCYLGTLPPTWNVNIKHLMSHFDTGRDKIKNTLKWLKDNHLLEYEQERTDGGKFGSRAIIIKDGFDFLLHNGLLDTAVPKTGTPVTAVLKTRSPVKPDTGKSAPIKYISNKNKNNERESVYPVDNFEKEDKKLPLKLISSNFKPSQKQKELANEYDLVLEKEIKSFIDYYKSKGDKREKWRPEFSRWLERSHEYKLKERPVVFNTNNILPRNTEAPRPKMRDITQERLDREASTGISEINMKH